MKQPQPLQYATRVGEYPEPGQHPGIIVLLIGLTALAGIWCIILAVGYALDMWLYSSLLFGAGITLCWATVGKLPAPNPKFKPALLLLSVGVACAVALTIHAHFGLLPQLARYGSSLPENPNLRALATYEEKQVFTHEMIRNAGAVTAILGGILWVYVAVKMVARRAGIHEA